MPFNKHSKSKFTAQKKNNFSKKREQKLESKKSKNNNQPEPEEEEVVEGSLSDTKLMDYDDEDLDYEAGLVNSDGEVEGAEGASESSEPEEKNEKDQKDTNDEFFMHGDDLDLPDASEDFESDLDSKNDSELDDIYRDLGVDLPLKLKPEKRGEPEKQVKTSLQEEEKQKKIEEMLSKIRNSPSFKNVNTFIQIVKQVFNSEQSKTPAPKDKNVKLFSNALSQVQYAKLFNFFLTELPNIMIEHILSPQLKLKCFLKTPFNMKKTYSELSSKQNLLMRSYAANYNKLIKQALEDRTSGSQWATFFVSGSSVVKICLPFKIYTKKLVSNMATMLMQYSRVGDVPTQLMIFDSLNQILGFICNIKKEKTKNSDDEEVEDESSLKSVLELTLKKMYFEFAKESKVGGGSNEVQDTLRTAQNCFVELLNHDISLSYKLGFLYIRQMCLHLRNLRNQASGVGSNQKKQPKDDKKKADNKKKSKSGDNVKTAYSWQLFNCIKIWGLALGRYKNTELSLLIHPLVQLITGLIKLSTALKYWPFHIKLLDLMTTIQQQTQSLIPCMQFILNSLYQTYGQYFNTHPKKLEDKQIPDTQISIKISKKHIDTAEMKERILIESLKSLENYYQSLSRHVCFPELIIPALDQLSKFKKILKLSGYRDHVIKTINLLKKNQEIIKQKRIGVKLQILGQKRSRQVELKGIQEDELDQEFKKMLLKIVTKMDIKEKTPLEQEGEKMQKRIKEKKIIKETKLI